MSPFFRRRRQRQAAEIAGTPETPAQLRDYADQYSETRFWTKLSHVFKRAGYELVEKALWLHYAAQRPDTPQWARATAYGALAYFIMPFDAVPDWLFGIGLTDDLGALTLAVATISQYVDEQVKRQASARLAAWFGPQARHGRPSTDPNAGPDDTL
ncbi:YkvA family protein [Salinisphaera sp. Q1T1-3]|uniref:YkvA family protein n=1 Tax=Salinisphaera sp. Q1T1-3 TaxID=2321229 RepID=UPI000E70F388|nr:YkvA family protein [Salinisphaera sp. Q1T1-3]RJS93987.1 DUF1232 domain-containing protein [Salinisphaera sp. Q1T1-3]